MAPSFAERLEQLLAEHPECDPGYLELEILETSALSDVERAGQTLTVAAHSGVRDRAGRLRHGLLIAGLFPPLADRRAEDRPELRARYARDPDDMEIVESVVRLAHAFKRMVIAEGVETPEHGPLLTLLGCRLGQGFGIARPMPANAVPGWVSTWPEQGGVWLSKRASVRRTFR